MKKEALKVRQILNAVPALRSIAAASLPAAMAYRVSRVIGQIDAESNRIKELSDELAAKRAAELEGENEPSEELKAKHEAELEALLEEMCEIEVRPVPLSALNGVELRPIDVVNVEWLFEDDSEDVA